MSSPSVFSVEFSAHRTDTAYPRADDFKVPIEGDQIRTVSRRDPSKLGLEAQKCRGRPRSHDEGIDKGDFEQRNSVAHRLDYGEVSAGDTRSTAKFDRLRLEQAGQSRIE